VAYRLHSPFMLWPQACGDESLFLAYFEAVRRLWRAVCGLGISVVFVTSRCVAFIRCVLATGALGVWLYGALPSYAQDKNADGYRAIERGDYLNALYYWRPRAEQNNAEAQFMMGWLTQYGLGVEQNYAEALRWYQKAATQNYALAQSNIGVMYDVGLGVGQDQKQAVIWYQKAAEQGNATAQFNLGWLYQSGAGVAQNFEKAAQLYQEAARQGNGPAQFNLGILYDDGKGVQRDLDLAYMWLNLAASTLRGDGQQAATKARDGVAQRMTADHIAQAQARAQSCLSSHFAMC
jgi:uncharacterized protein